MKKYFIAVLLLLCACAKQHPADISPEIQTAAAARWQKFTASNTTPAYPPYRLQMSLRFGTADDTRRVTALFWGNGDDKLRMDVMAGVGAVAARILEDGQHFLIYSPNENKAWFYQGATKPLSQMGMPVPFDLKHLENLLNGRYALVFGTTYNDSGGLQNGLMRYTLTDKLGGSLTLNTDGLPVLWRDDRHAASGWTMEIAYNDSTPPLPRRLSLTNDNGKRAIVLIKERENPTIRFTDEQMRLALPENTPLWPLAQYKSQRF
ncbi:hypothetical protein AGMMS49974_01810 [Deltaproteobacteria bacterium]|nr:hypothetical protein AGMMS49974_01810 [Deltaproteobacteria bacterium]